MKSMKPGQIDKEFAKFCKQFPNGGIYRAQFAKLFPTMRTVHFCDHIFRTLDQDGNGYLDFREFVMADELAAAKTAEEKLSWAFRVYDVDRSGTVDLKEMTKVMRSIYAMVGETNKTREELEDKATSHAAQLFKKTDVDGDKELSEEEFIQGCKNDKDLMSKLDQLIKDVLPTKK